jgi:hypothetical protein
VAAGEAEQAVEYRLDRPGASTNRFYVAGGWPLLLQPAALTTGGVGNQHADARSNPICVAFVPCMSHQIDRAQQDRDLMEQGTL